MKHSDKYFLRNIAEDFFLVPADDVEENEKKLIFLNETSAFLWNRMGTGCSPDDLTKSLLDQFNVSEEIASQHVMDFISFLSENGCLEVEERI